MDIAALSAVMANSQIRGQASMLMVKKQMTAAEDQGAALVQMMEQSVTPYKGQSIDLKL